MENNMHTIMDPSIWTLFKKKKKKIFKFTLENIPCC